MATPGVIARISEDGWHGTHVTYDGVPEHIGPLLLNLFVELKGDFEAVWARVSAPDHGWTSFLEKPRDDPRWSSGGLGAFVVDSKNQDYAGDTACWYLLDFDARTLLVQVNNDEPDSLLTIDQLGIAGCEGPVDPGDWRNRRQTYGVDDPARCSRDLVDAVSAALPMRGSGMSITLVEQPGKLAGMIRSIGLAKDGVRADERGVVADLMLRMFDPEEGDVQDVAQTAPVLVPRRCLTDRARANAFIRGWLNGLAQGVGAGGALSIWSVSSLVPTDLLDLELSPAELERLAGDRARALLAD